MKSNEGAYRCFIRISFMIDNITPFLTPGMDSSGREEEMEVVRNSEQ